MVHQTGEMGMNAYIKSTIVITFTTLLCFSPSIATADNTAISTERDFPDSEFEFDDMLPLFLDAPEESDAALWDWLQSQDNRPHLRARVIDPTNDAYPAHFMRLLVNTNSFQVGAILAREADEPDALDHWRVAVESDRNLFRVILGDFRVDQALGWTVATTPSGSAATDPLGPLRRPTKQIRMNLSSEEGYGWQGLALSLGSQQSPVPVRLDLWGGYADYEGRLDSDGYLIPYSTQGNHANRPADLPSLTSIHIGSHLSTDLPQNSGQLNLTAAATRFNEPMSHKVTSARFRFADQEFSALGLGLKWERDQIREHSISTEITRQNTGAWGGAVVTASQINPATRIIGYLWRATQSFSTFHARPSQVFGTDPAGITGSQMAVQLVKPETVVSFGVAADWKEAQPSADQRESVFIRLETQALTSFDMDASVRLRHDQLGSGPSTDHLISRLWFRHHQKTSSLAARVEANHHVDGSGIGLTISVHERVSSLLLMSFAISGVAQNGEGAVISLVEPTGPGIFPIIRTSQNSFDLFPELTSSLIILCNSGWLFGFNEIWNQSEKMILRWIPCSPSDWSGGISFVNAR